MIAPAAVHVVATGKDAVAFEGAEKLVAELEAKGLEVIYDDRKKVSPGVKFKDAELIGVPLVAVVGRDYVRALRRPQLSPTYSASALIASSAILPSRRMALCCG